MKEFTIGPNDAGQRLDRFLAKAVPLLPASLAQKYIRLKRIKCNGKRIDRDTRLNTGDLLQLYINDEFFDKPREDNAYLTVASPKLNIVYEDEHILLVDKRPVWLFIPTTARNMAGPSSTTSSPICTKRKNGDPGRRMPSPLPCATASTGTPAASSLPPRPPRRCGS